jgi:hypothetical protein
MRSISWWPTLNCSGSGHGYRSADPPESQLAGVPLFIAGFAILRNYSRNEWYPSEPGGNVLRRSSSERCACSAVWECDT